MNWLVLLVVMFGLVGANLEDFPPKGVYMVLRNDALQTIGAQISLLIGDQANTYTNTPPVNGQTDSATYTFDTFIYDIDLDDFYMSGSAPTITVGWNLFNFILQFNYHICSTSWPNPCENGYIQVYTVNPIKMNTVGNLDLTGPTVHYTATGANLMFNQGDVEIEVQCTDTFCLIPTDDIANAVAQGFVSAFQTALVGILNQSAQKYINTIETSVDVPAFGVSIQLDGDFYLYPSSNPNFVFAGQGAFTADGNSKRPPFTPSFIPPDSAFTNPSSPLTLLNTDFMFETAIWALNLKGAFNYTITEADLPVDSPFHLKTNDPFFLLAAPGLKSFPNMDIIVKVALMNISSIQISPQGIFIKNTFLAVFTLTNSTYSHPGFSLLVDISFEVTEKVVMKGESLVFNTSFSGWQGSAIMYETSVGSIWASIFSNAIQLFLSFHPPVAPAISFQAPNDFAISNPVSNVFNGYFEIGTNIEYTVPIPGISCPGGSKTCPEETTCCQWNGSWGCCTLPGASCCSSGGCCPNGFVCQGGECYQDQTGTRMNQTITPGHKSKGITLPC